MPTIQCAFQRDPATGQILFDADGYPLQAVQTGANTFADLTGRITNEVLGGVTATQVNNAVWDAIATFERESFWFNRTRSFGDVSGSLSDLQTVQGKEFYSFADLPVLINMPHITKILVLAYNNRYPLNSRTPQWIDDQSVSPSWNGWPTDWCWDSGALRLYPIPNAAYPLIIDATIRFRALASGTDYNCWTNEAEALIRFEAKRLLFTNIRRDAGQAMAMEGEIYGNSSIGRQGILPTLRRESTRRASGPGKIRASAGYM